MLRDKTGTFKIPLILAGCLEIIGVVIAVPACFVKSKLSVLGGEDSRTIVETSV